MLKLRTSIAFLRRKTATIRRKVVQRRLKQPSLNTSIAIISREETNLIDKHISNFSLLFYGDRLVAAWDYLQSLEPGWKLTFKLAIGESRNVIHSEDVTGKSFVTLPRLSLSKEHYLLIGFLELSISQNEKLIVSVREHELLHTDDPAFYYILNEYQRLFLQRSGSPMILLTTRYGGMPCPRCYNPSLKKATNPHCESCLGTGYMRGYNDPIEVRGIISQMPSETKNQNPNLQYPRAWSLMLPATVRVNEGDLIFLQENGVLLKVGEVMPVRWGVIPIIYRVMATVHNNPKVLRLFGLQQKQVARTVGPTLL